MIKRKDFYPPYRAAILKTYNDDLNKRWVIEYWPWHEAKDKVDRKQHFISSVKYTSAKERKAYADAFIRDIDDKLRKGYFVPDKSKIVSLESAIKGYLEYKLKIIKSHKDYVPLFKVMVLEWFEEQKPGKTVDKITKADIYDFLDTLQRERNWTNVTRNVKRSKLYNFFQYLVDREIIHNNPVAKVRNEKEEKGVRYYPFLDHEISMLREYIQEHEPIIKLFTDFVYYAFLRPKEVRQLKISDIDMIKKRIRVSRKVAKNTKTEYIQIPKTLQELIKKSGIMEYKKHYLIFGNQGTPGLTMYGHNYFTRKTRLILDKFGFSSDYSLYSFKHSGCCKLYEITKDIKLVSAQCRHHSIEVTDIYLRSLGMYATSRELDGFI